MKKIVWLCLACLILLVSTATAHASNAPELRQVLNTLRATYPQATVIGRFYDWRTVSIYRSHAGLHLGYDIALPQGATVTAAWSGRVVDIVHWYGSQYGITVQTDDRFTTYGHLQPLVAVGTQIKVGQAVGRTLIDHVDIKMRDSAGNYVDFGGDDNVLPNHVPTPQELAEQVTRLQQEVATLSEQTDELSNGSLQRHLQNLRQELTAVEPMAANVPTLVSQGIASVRESTTLLAKRDWLRDQMHEAEQTLRGVSTLRSRLAQAREQLVLAQASARIAGVTVNRVARAVPQAAGNRQPSADKTRYLQSLYQEGCISQAELTRLLQDPSWNPPPQL